METKIKNYLLVFGLGIITLTSCNHSKEQDIVASNFAFAEQQLKYALTQIDEARANESQESREKRENKGWGELTNPRSIKPDGSLELVVSKDWTSGFFPGELWYLYEYTHNPYWKEQAQKHTEILEREKNNGKTHDMGSLRGFKHKEPVAKPFTDPEFPVNNDSFLDVGTCEDAVAYLSNPPEEPFICIADFQNPHNICGFVGANEGVHTDRPISGTLPELPANFNVEDWSNIPKPVQYICCSHRRMTQASHWNEENYRHYIAAFQHYTKMVSKQVDSVLKALYSTPAGKNTIVIIMADHGDGMASHRMVTKHISFYDEMTNVPFIFAGPGIKQQKKPIDQVLTQPTLDLLPTLCDLAGIPVPAEKPGISLAPILKGEKQKKTHPYVVSEWHSEYEYVVTPGRMVRGPRYKYTHYLEGNGEELYDMKKDPGERKNLAKDPKYSKVLAEHRAMLDDYIARTKDDYRSLKVDADPRCRNHTPGYPNHEGPGVREILKRK